MSGPFRQPRRLVPGLALAAAVAALWAVGCTNDPFDPESIPNRRPVARIFISPLETDTLNATSYFRRTFRWSGSDADGFVTDYFVTLQSPADTPAPWDTTTRTDTTMTFTTDDEGHAEVLLRVACRDDRGAVSDTVSQYIPLRNFPPVINYQADFDSVRWSYGASTFRLFALDLDGNETLETTYRYKLDTADTTVVRDYGTAGADPALCWVRRPFAAAGDWNITIDLTGVAPASPRTLTVAVRDEALAEARRDCVWEVREARGPVLLVADASPFVNELYYATMDSLFGVDAWSLYETRDGLPDADWVLLETFREFEVLLWYTGATGAPNLVEAVPVLLEYLQPTEPATPGRLLLVSRVATGAFSDLPAGFIQTVLGVSPTASPPNVFYVPAGKIAFGLHDWLPDIASTASFAGAVGQAALAGTEPIFRLEECRDCYDVRPPFDPVIATRRPALDPLAPAPAQVVLVTAQLEYFGRDETREALQALLVGELGVSLP